MTVAYLCEIDGTTFNLCEIDGTTFNVGDSHSHPSIFSTFVLSSLLSMAGEGTNAWRNMIAKEGRDMGSLMLIILFYKRTGKKIADIESENKIPIDKLVRRVYDNPYPWPEGDVQGAHRFAYAVTAHNYMLMAKSHSIAGEFKKVMLTISTIATLCQAVMQILRRQHEYMSDNTLSSDHCGDLHKARFKVPMLLTWRDFVELIYGWCGPEGCVILYHKLNQYDASVLHKQGELLKLPEGHTAYELMAGCYRNGVNDCWEPAGRCRELEGGRDAILQYLLISLIMHHTRVANMFDREGRHAEVAKHTDLARKLCLIAHSQAEMVVKARTMLI